MLLVRLLVPIQSVALPSLSVVRLAVAIPSAVPKPAADSPKAARIPKTIAKATPAALSPNPAAMAINPKAIAARPMEIAAKRSAVLVMEATAAKSSAVPAKVKCVAQMARVKAVVHPSAATNIRVVTAKVAKASVEVPIIAKARLR